MPTLTKTSTSSTKTQKKIASKNVVAKQDSDQNTKESASGDEESQSESEEDEDLHGLTTDDDDSSDEDDNLDANPIDIDKLPTVAKDDAVVRAKLEKAKRQTVSKSCVVCSLPLTSARLTIAASYTLAVYRMDFSRTN
jgi:hypothetical protein